MGATNVTIKQGGALSVTGGTNQIFTLDGVKIDSGVHLQDAAQLVYRDRMTLVLKTKPPVLERGVYTKEKRWIVLQAPTTLVSGAIVQNLVRIEIEIHPDWASANADELVKSAAQLLFSADLQSFIKTGNLS